MATLQIPDELASLIELGAQRAGESREVFIREAIRSHIEDMQDVATAKEHLLNPDDTLSLDEMKKNLGLDD
jgi:predicted DNA-binding protein